MSKAIIPSFSTENTKKRVVLCSYRNKVFSFEEKINEERIIKIEKTYKNTK